jgi:U3 small nucleolar RNA-associated protein 7
LLSYRVWDLRTYGELNSFRLPLPPTQIAFSDQNNVAVTFGTKVHIYKDIINDTPTRPYMQYNTISPVSSLAFCPFEDILGVGHNRGFCSLLIPGCGDPNFDALHANPYESKKQRQEREVRQLLEKIQPNMITLNPKDINRVNQTELEKNMKFRKDIMHWKNTDLNTNPSRYFSRKKVLK